MRHLHEVIEYDYKGIKVCVKINHIAGKVSLVDRASYDWQSIEKKQWIFADRGLEYMKGWQTILDAMKYAIAEATKILEKDLAESSRFKNGDLKAIKAKKK